MLCRLCLEERDLCASHIIPEFLYRPGYDEKHRMEVIRRASPEITVIQKGFREQLLCAECEGLLSSRYENYFADLWYSRQPHPPTTSQSLILLTQLDYTKFKLFHLSVLWRAHVSSLAPFRIVSLGPHAETIRQMILAEDPGPPSRYQIIATAVLFPGTREILEGMICGPMKAHLGGNRMYMFLFGGCLWMYLVGAGDVDMVRPAALSEQGQITLLVNDWTRITPLDRFMREHMALPARASGT